LRKYKQFIELKNKIKKLKSELADVTSEKDELQAELLAEMALDNITGMVIDGKVVYTSRRVWLGGNTPDIVRALRGTSGEWMIKENVNRTSLSAWGREQVEEYALDSFDMMSCEEIQKALPGNLGDTILVTEKFTLNVKNKS